MNIITKERKSFTLQHKNHNKITQFHDFMKLKSITLPVIM